jgi:hypothetical protein
MLRNADGFNCIDNASYGVLALPLKAVAAASGPTSSQQQPKTEVAHRRIGRLFGARAAAEEQGYSVASQLNCVPLVSFRRQITRSEMAAEGSR